MHLEKLSLLENKRDLIWCQLVHNTKINNDETHILSQIFKFKKM